MSPWAAGRGAPHAFLPLHLAKSPDITVAYSFWGRGFVLPMQPCFSRTAEEEIAA